LGIIDRQADLVVLSAEDRAFQTVRFSGAMHHALSAIGAGWFCSAQKACQSKEGVARLGVYQPMAKLEAHITAFIAAHDENPKPCK